MDAARRMLTWDVTGNVSKIRCSVNSYSVTVRRLPWSWHTRAEVLSVVRELGKGRVRLWCLRDAGSTPGSAVERGRVAHGQRGSGFAARELCRGDRETVPVKWAEAHFFSSLLRLCR